MSALVIVMPTRTFAYNDAMSRKLVIKSEPENVLYRVKRGLCGYVSYLAACEMNEAFSEYVLYEPILRILTARGFSVRCEYECPGIEQPRTGAKKRLDFFVSTDRVQFALEVKWAKKSRPAIDRDIAKLQCAVAASRGTRAFLCVFGRRSNLEKLELRGAMFREQGKPVYADFGATRFGCRIYELA